MIGLPIGRLAFLANLAAVIEDRVKASERPRPGQPAARITVYTSAGTETLKRRASAATTASPATGREFPDAEQSA